MDILLVVDDEPSIQKSIARVFLDEAEIEVVTASSAQEASQILTKKKVDVIISDERMPQVSGTDFLHYVKNRYPEIQRIILTGYASQEATIKAINNAEVFRFLTKPWDQTDLLMTVKRAIEKKRLKEANDALNEQVLAQKEALERANEDLEAKVAERTEQLRKTLEVIKKQNATLKAQRVGVAELLMSVFSDYDPEKARLSTQIASAWTHFLELAKLEAAEDSEYAVRLRVIFDDPQGLYLKMLSTVDGFAGIVKIIALSKENYDGSGEQKLAAEAIPAESRILRIIYDYYTLNPRKFSVSRMFILSQSDKIYDGKFAKLFLETVKDVIDENLSNEVRVENLVVGMVLVKDLKLVNGSLLLPSGTLLSQPIVNQLQKVKQFIDGNPSVSVNLRSE